ncbi:MAG: ComF family protein [Elusimicrobiota bacterium]|nr:ComF family protein [Elusimicrobiota bacterium]
MNLIDFIFPKTCIVCSSFISDKNKKILCENCISKIKFVQSPICVKCGVPMHSAVSQYCKNCISSPESIPYEFLRGICVYDTPVKDLIHQLKYSGKEYVAYFLADIICDYIQEHNELSAVDFVVPVPLHWWKKIKRGYNQSELIAKAVVKKMTRATAWKGRIQSGNLFRKKYTKPQVNLTREDRLKNVCGAFEVKHPEVFENKSVLLIDDVCTTGSTIENCACVLRGAGAKKVYALTVARD